MKTRNKTLPAAAGLLLILLFSTTTSACLRLQDSDFDATTTDGLVWPFLFARRAFALGQPDTNSVQGIRLGMQLPYKLSIAGGKLFLTDSQNRRVLVYNTLPTANQAAPDIALGQPDIHTTLVAASAYPFDAIHVNRGRAVYSDGTRLFVVDNQGHRVLIWNTIPTTNAQAADLVVGQADFTSSANSTATMDSPEGVAACGTHLFVADSSNNRVLIWNTIPTTNGQTPDVVLGQATLGTNVSGNGANQLNSPKGVYCDGTKLYVADSNNSRVLIWNSIPITNAQNANHVVGQAGFGSGTSGNTAADMNQPEEVHANGSNMYVADTGNHRVLVFNFIPASNGQSATSVLGQPGFGSVSANNPDISAGLSDPRGVVSDGTNLYITDSGNNRMVIHQTALPANGATPALVVGQPGLTTSHANYVQPTAAQYFGTGTVTVVGERLYVGASSDNRVLGYNSIPTTSGASADFVLGQQFFTTNGSDASATTMNGPGSMCVIGTTLYVAETQNNRILGFNTIPTTTGQAADFVLGQNDFTGSMQNKGTSVAADTLANPTTVHCETSRLVVADTSNHRILIYAPPPTTTNASATIVVGQPNMTTATSMATQAGLTGPQNAIVDSNGRLIIADSQSNRVVIHNSVPSSDGANADLVLGQADFVGQSSHGGSATPTNSGFSFPTSIMVLNGNLAVGDLFNNRILIWNTFPTVSNQGADKVFGQSNFTDVNPNPTGVGPASFNAPSGMYFHDGLVYIPDAFNQRVLVVLAGDMGFTGL